MQETLVTFTAAVRAALDRWDLPIRDEQLDMLFAHFQAVVEANRTMNLTRITDPVQAAVKHYADSLALLAWARNRNVAVKTVLDVGTGAGFPAVPLAVLRPDWSVTAIDATGKKVEFLRRAAAALRLTNLDCQHAHSRHWKPGRAFPLVVFRALTTLPAALEHIATLVSPDGRLVAYKTASMDAGERTAARDVAAGLRLKQGEPYAYDLEIGDERLERTLVIYKRVRRNQRGR